MLLEHVKSITPDAELEAEFTKLTEEVQKIINQIGIITEAPMDAMADRLAGDEERPMPRPGEVETGGSMEEIMTSMDQVMKQMDAARRGLGIVNKLADSPSRTRNRSRVMGNMNRIRGNLQRIEKMLASME